MAIIRTAMIDDDGSGTTGTIINNAWKTEFYNQIDSATGAPTIARLRYTPAVAATLPVGVHDDYRPTGGENAVMWQLAGAGVGVALQSILAEPDQTSHLLVNTSANAWWLYNGHASPSANAIICPGLANYLLNPYHSIWIVYLGVTYGKWLALQP